jgi:hypothetical protein
VHIITYLSLLQYVILSLYDSVSKLFYLYASLFHSLSIILPVCNSVSSILCISFCLPYLLISPSVIMFPSFNIFLSICLFTNSFIFYLFIILSLHHIIFSLYHSISLSLSLLSISYSVLSDLLYIVHCVFL